MSVEKNLTLQEKRLAQAQRAYDMALRAADKMKKAVDAEVARLEEMQRQHVTAMEEAPFEGNAIRSIPSQYDKFGDVQSNRRLRNASPSPGMDLSLPKPSAAGDVSGQSLTPGTDATKILPATSRAGNAHMANGNDGLSSGAGSPPVPSPVMPPGNTDLSALVKAANNTELFSSTAGRAETFSQISAYPGKPVYVSGYYYSSGPQTKRYEYQLNQESYSESNPIKVGDMIEAPVHLAGWHEGRQANPHWHNRRFIVESIHTKAEFARYHDGIPYYG